MNILHIDSSILGQDSASRELGAAIVARLRRESPGAEVTDRDHAAPPQPPHSAGSRAGPDPPAAAGRPIALRRPPPVGVPMPAYPVTRSPPTRLKSSVSSTRTETRASRSL